MKKIIFGVVALVVFATNILAIDISGMSESEIKKHDRCLKLSKSMISAGMQKAVWPAYMRTGCKEHSFYAKFEAAKSEHKKMLADKKEQKRLSEEKARKERIVKEKAEKLALAKKNGFNSYEEYQSDLRKKEQEKKEKLAKSKGYKSHKAYTEALAKKEKEEYAKKYPYQVVVGCGDIGGQKVTVNWCLKSLKVNGRFVFSNSGDMYHKYGNVEEIKVGVPSKFNATLAPGNGRLYYLKVIDSITEQELHYNEKQNKYSTIKVFKK